MLITSPLSRRAIVISYDGSVGASVRYYTLTLNAFIIFYLILCVKHA